MSQTSKRGLGKGLGALISDDFDKSILLDSNERVEKIPISSLVANPYQPRTIFEDDSLKEMSESIKEHGIIQPLVVSKTDNDKYYIIAGERRWRAAKLANLSYVPAIIRTTEKQEQLELALIENVQRVDLSPLEQAASIRLLHEQFSLSYEEIAKRLGKAASTIHNNIRLLGLPENAKNALINQKISEGHARAILALKGDNERQEYLLKTIVNQHWSVRQAERFVTSVKAGFKKVNEAHARTSLETDETKILSKILETDVFIRRSAKGGRIEIAFKNDESLQKLINKLQNLR